MAIGSILFLLLALVLAAFIGAVLWFMFKTMTAPVAEPPDFTPDGEYQNPRPHNIPACGKCGYSAYGISTFECPECGADLREVGIVTAGSGLAKWCPPPTMTGCVLPLVWTLGMLLGLFALNGVVRELAPTTVGFHYGAVLTPNSASYDGISLVIETTERNVGYTRYNYASPPWPQVTPTLDLQWLSSKSQIQHITFHLFPWPVVNQQALNAQFHIDPYAATFAYKDVTGTWIHNVGQPTAADFLSWLDANGLSSQDAATQAEAVELAGLYQVVMTRAGLFPLAHFSIAHQQDSVQVLKRNEWFQLSFGLLWCLGWLFGLIFFARRHPNKMRKIIEHAP